MLNHYLSYLLYLFLCNVCGLLSWVWSRVRLKCFSLLSSKKGSVSYSLISFLLFFFTAQVTLNNTETHCEVISVNVLPVLVVPGCWRERERESTFLLLTQKKKALSVLVYLFSLFLNVFCMSLRLHVRCGGNLNGKKTVWHWWKVSWRSWGGVAIPGVADKLCIKWHCLWASKQLERQQWKSQRFELPSVNIVHF